MTRDGGILMGVKLEPTREELEAPSIYGPGSLAAFVVARHGDAGRLIWRTSLLRWWWIRLRVWLAAQ